MTSALLPLLELTLMSRRRGCAGRSELVLVMIDATIADEHASYHGGRLSHDDAPVIYGLPHAVVTATLHRLSIVAFDTS